ncbi:MAG: PaaI family thioesterase [Firmicutes bacterium]|nr:PaaI family thioesterase [Bacillota bacterium]
MPDLSPAAAQALEAALRAHPFGELMGVELESAGTGRAAVACTVSARQANLHGTLHGGVVAALLDLAMGAALYTLNVRPLTLELTVTYLAPANPGDRVTAAGEVVHLGRRIIVARATLRGPAGTVAGGCGLYLPRGSL